MLIVDTLQALLQTGDEILKRAETIRILGAACYSIRKRAIVWEESDRWAEIGTVEDLSTIRMSERGWMDGERENREDGVH